MKNVNELLDLKVLKDWQLCDLYLTYKDDWIEWEFNWENLPDFFFKHEIDIVYKLVKNRHSEDHDKFPEMYYAKSLWTLAKLMNELSLNE